MRIFVTVVFAIGAIVALYFIVQAVVRIKTRELHKELAAKQKKIDQLQQEVEELHADEPEKMRLLRTENATYDKLVDDILGALTPSTLLQLSTPQEQIADLIKTRRPQRTF